MSYSWCDDYEPVQTNFTSVHINLTTCEITKHDIFNDGSYDTNIVYVDTELDEARVCYYGGVELTPEFNNQFILRVLGKINHDLAQIDNLTQQKKRLQKLLRKEKINRLV